MNLIRTSFFSAIITIIRISSGFIANKVVAVFAGAPGVAIVGAFANFISIVLTFSNGAINTGVVKYTAEFEDDEAELKTLFSTALKITLFCSVLTGISLIVLAPYWSSWIFAQQIYEGPIRILGFTVVFYALNTLLISILNGKKQISTYTIVNTLGSIIGLVFTVALVYFYEIQGALYAMVLAQSIVFFITAGLLIKSPWFSWEYFNKIFDKSKATKLSHYSLMAIVSALTLPVSQILFRNILITKFGIDQAGYWQGMMRISDAYLMIITTSLSTYFLPKLSSIKTDSGLRSEIMKGFKLIVPFLLLSCLGIYFFRFILIKLLFTSDFIAMGQLFYWQLIGDFFKMTSWILAYLMLAKAMTKMYIFSEIVFSFGYVGLGYLFVEKFQLEGAVMSFAMTYFFYFLFMLFVFKKLLFNKSQ
ncbi:O-antigen translocase [Flavobacterium sp. XS2P12]|uniref:O-antigen translocase n=1 Tax=Flavobacterium melibiosi TaxID=3398734 RepID=UPI003A85D17D